MVVAHFLCPKVAHRTLAHVSQSIDCHQQAQDMTSMCPGQFVYRTTFYSLVPETLHPELAAEKKIFAVMKDQKVWYEPQGGGEASGPITLPGINEDTEAAVEYGGTVFLITRDGKLSKPLLGRGPPMSDDMMQMLDWSANSKAGQESVSRRMFKLYELMDWSAQAVYTYGDRIYLVKDGLVRS